MKRRGRVREGLRPQTGSRGCGLVELAAVSLQGYHPTGSLGAAWPRTAELNWLLHPGNLQKPNLQSRALPFEEKLLEMSYV